MGIVLRPEVAYAEGKGSKAELVGEEIMLLEKIQKGGSVSARDCSVKTFMDAGEVGDKFVVMSLLAVTQI